MDYCPIEKMWCDILNKPKQGAPYWLDHSHFMNVPVYYDYEVDHNATHPTLLDTKQDNKIEFLPRNWNIPKADPNPVRRSVLGSGLEDSRWDST